MIGIMFIPAQQKRSMKVKAIVIFIIFILYLPLYAQSITEKFEYREHSAYDRSIPYRIFIPENYTESVDYPLVLTLHGSGLRGSDNQQQIEITMTAKVWVEDSIQEKYPSFIVSPQCPPARDWYDQLDILSHLLFNLIEEFSIDTTRIYVTGWSMGGYGTFNLMTFSPFQFAAIVPMCGGGAPNSISLLSQIPAVWNFHSIIDNSVPVEDSRDMIVALEEVLGFEAVYTDLKNGGPTPLPEQEIDSLILGGAPLIYTEYAGYGHSIWDQSYTNPKLLPWVFSHQSDGVLSKVPAYPKTSAKSMMSLVVDRPVLQYGETGSWDEGGVYNPVVIKDSDTLRMWYIGTDITPNVWNGESHLGYAWSIDGVVWTRYFNNPVFMFDLSVDQSNVLDFNIIKDGEEYKMWYSSEFRDFFPAGVGYATSYDGINWIRHSETVLSSGESGDWDYPNIGMGTIIKEEDTYKMWYYGGSWFTGFQIGMATSSNGIQWEKYNNPTTPVQPYQNSDPVLLAGQLGLDWDFHKVMYPAVLKNEYGYEMWYTGSNISNFFTCYATSMDGETWTKSDSRPTLHESPPWHTHGWYLGKSVLNSDLVNHIWFTHTDGFGGRPQIGYAQDFNRIVHADSLWINQSYVKPEFDTLLVSARIKNSHNHMLNVEAQLESEDRTVMESVILTSDGLSSDFWSGSWPVVAGERDYLLLNLKVSDLDTGSIVFHHDSIRYTTIGPITVDNNTITSSDTIPNHGDRLTFKLNLKNNGNTTTATTISTKVTNLDTCTQVFHVTDPEYGDIAPGEVVEPSRGISIKFNENCPDSIFVQIKVDIYSQSYTFWSDTFSIFLHKDPTGLVKNDENIPIEFVLEQNYPNPFNPSTKIKFALPKADKVKIELYNTLGQNVKTLLNKAMKAGHHEVVFNAQNLSSGVYFYRIEAGEFQDVKKMILLR
jgi:predicted esterase/predicted GH43/DUF377 family glycosyl hydrolase